MSPLYYSHTAWWCWGGRSPALSHWSPPPSAEHYEPGGGGAEQRIMGRISTNHNTVCLLTHSHTLSHTHTHTYLPLLWAHANTQKYITHTLVWTNKYMEIKHIARISHTHMDTHTHTHTHTHTQRPSLSSFLSWYHRTRDSSSAAQEWRTEGVAESSSCPSASASYPQIAFQWG